MLITVRDYRFIDNCFKLSAQPFKLFTPTTTKMNPPLKSPQNPKGLCYVSQMKEGFVSR